MRPQKAMATACDSAQTVANRKHSRTTSYFKPEYLSNKIDLLLGNLLLALQCFRPSLERTAVLYAIDGLLRLKIEIRQRDGVRCG
jgi:hypothetical protein